MLIGNGGGGTSLLRGLLNAHSKLTVLFEDKPGGGADNEINQWIDKSKEAEKQGLIWANKVPFEQFMGRGWENEDFLRLAENFKIIHLVRRYSKYLKPQTKDYVGYKRDWNRHLEVYWLIREAYPAKIMQVSFEDLLLRTVIELKRMCRFLGVRYEPSMIKGTLDTGYKIYNQGTINIEKV